MKACYRFLCSALNFETKVVFGSRHWVLRQREMYGGVAVVCPQNECPITDKRHAMLTTASTSTWSWQIDLVTNSDWKGHRAELDLLNREQS